MSVSTKVHRKTAWVLTPADAFVAFGAAMLAAVLTGPGWHGPFHAWEMTAVAVWSWVLAARLTGFCAHSVLRSGFAGSRPAVQASGVLALALLAQVAAGSITSNVHRATIWAVLTAALCLWGGLGARAALRGTRKALAPFGVGLERYGVVDNGDPARRLHGDLTRAPGSSFKVVASLSANPTSAATEAVGLGLDGVIVPDGYPADDAAQLAELLAPHGISVLIEPGTAGRLDLLLAEVTVLHGVPLLRAAPLAPKRKAIRREAQDRARRGVALLGTRGIPAAYGGFETFVERLALHCVDRNVPVTVYCRTAYATEGKSWRGIDLVTLPTIRSKYFDTVVHTALSAAHLVLTRGPRDVVMCNAANAPVLLLLKTFRRRVILNVDGLEWRRSKWGVAGRSWYRMGEWLSVRLADVLVTDAREVRTYYQTRHDTDSVMIPYGADLTDRGSIPVPPETPQVEPDRYVLYVSRWERENNPLMMASAHARANVSTPLVMLGMATYDDGLDAEVRAAAAPDCYLPGAVFGDGYKGLQSNARCYVHATMVGGTHPALIEALGAGNLVLVLDTPENREVAGPAAKFFRDENELVELLRWVDRIGDTELDQWRVAARTWAAATYTWNTVGDAYLGLLGVNVLSRSPSEPADSVAVENDSPART